MHACVFVPLSGVTLSVRMPLRPQMANVATYFYASEWADQS